MGDSITVKAYAKVNLALAVDPPEPPGSPRAGWHRIKSWMHCIDLHDEVTIEPRESGGVVLEREWAPDAPRPSPFDWPAEKDLCVRAVRALEKHTGREIHARIRVKKRIPVGGGLGGGSSDAAAVLMGINDLLGLNLSDRELQVLSAPIGSDVAFFVDNYERNDHEAPMAAIVSGFGDEMERIVGSGIWIALIVPTFGCDTRAVYRRFDELGAKRTGVFDEAGIRQAVFGDFDAALLMNDLTPAACDLEPRLPELIRRAEEAVGEPQIHMSGSGSTLFWPIDEARRAAGVEALRSIPDVTVVEAQLWSL